MIPIYSYMHIYIFIFLYIQNQICTMYILSLWLSCVKKISQDAPSLLRQELVLSAFQRAGAPERTTLGSIFWGDVSDT